MRTTTRPSFLAGHSVPVLVLNCARQTRAGAQALRRCGQRAARLQGCKAAGCGVWAVGCGVRCVWCGVWGKVCGLWCVGCVGGVSGGRAVEGRGGGGLRARKGKAVRYTRGAASSGSVTCSRWSVLSISTTEMPASPSSHTRSTRALSCIRVRVRARARARAGVRVGTGTGARVRGWG